MPLPIVSGEVHRLRTAFEDVANQMSAVLAMLSDLQPRGIGPGRLDDAAQTSVLDLAEACTGLRTVADDCVAATARHVVQEPSAMPAPPAGTGGGAHAG